MLERRSFPFSVLFRKPRFFPKKSERVPLCSDFTDKLFLSISLFSQSQSSFTLSRNFSRGCVTISSRVLSPIQMNDVLNRFTLENACRSVRYSICKNERRSWTTDKENEYVLAALRTVNYPKNVHNCKSTMLSRF